MQRTSTPAEVEMSKRLTHVALAGLLLILGARDAAAEIMRWQVDGETREAIVYVPASPGREGAPLVLSFHGAAGAARTGKPPADMPNPSRNAPRRITS